MDRECLFCGTVLDETRKDSYVCEECDYKIKLLKQITKLDSARTKIEKSVKSISEEIAVMKKKEIT